MQRFAYTLYVSALCTTMICIAQIRSIGKTIGLLGFFATGADPPPGEGQRLNLQQAVLGSGVAMDNATQASMSNPCDSTLMKACVKAASER